MDDPKITKLHVASDNTGEKRQKSLYNVYHTARSEDDLVVSTIEGYGMAHDVAFFVVDDAYNMVFFVPLNRIVYIESSPIVEPVNPNDLN